jgi:hypothetical protein
VTLGQVKCVALHGLDGAVVTVEAHIAPQLDQKVDEVEVQFVSGS